MYKIVAPISMFSDLELALMVLFNVFGSGNDRRKRLGDRFSAVQTIVNQIVATKIIPAGKGSASDDAIRKVFKQMEPSAEEYDEFINEFLNALKEVQR